MASMSILKKILYRQLNEVLPYNDEWLSMEHPDVTIKTLRDEMKRMSKKEYIEELKALIEYENWVLKDGLCGLTRQPSSRKKKK